MQAAGQKPLRQLALIITKNTNNYKPKSGPSDHTKRSGFQQLQVITEQPSGRLATQTASVAHLGQAGQVAGRQRLKELAPVTTKLRKITSANPARATTPSGLDYKNYKKLHSSPPADSRPRPRPRRTWGQLGMRPGESPSCSWRQ